MKSYVALVVAALLSTTALATVVPPAYRFDVLLDDKPIGSHSFIFSPSTDIPRGYQLLSSARYEVNFLFFTAYAYEHRSEEIWQGKCLQRIRSATDDNGEEFRVEGALRNGQFPLSVNGQDEAIDKSCVRTYAYWDRQALLASSALLNSQTGELEQVRVEREESSPPPWDSATPAQSLMIHTPHSKVQVWYRDNRWLGLMSRLESGRTIIYRPTTTASPDQIDGESPPQSGGESP